MGTRRVALARVRGVGAKGSGEEAARGCSTAAAAAVLQSERAAFSPPPFPSPPIE